ncbi:lebercilin-like protein isoform X1 [Amblyraja radiata]|uniref:lebercilin-like protein isoform X1 n=1 Tax=Amblyraja radiata TaxID=386614 RepID=UPI0014029BE1|nr:lebercilin-like protein isoform X1 [Amblyraja radiata]
MASEQGLRDSSSDQSSRRQGKDSTSSSDNSDNKTNNSSKSSTPRRNSAYTEYSEDFDNHCSTAESLKRENEKEKVQEAKKVKESVQKNNNIDNRTKVQPKARLKMLQNWNQNALKNKTQKMTKFTSMEQACDSVTRHILSARLNKTKELKNEVYDLQRELENARLENRLLRQLQFRHMKALVKFENEQNNLPQLLARHEGEVQMLKEMLRKSKEQDRCVAKQLKEAELELWKIRSSQQKLKTICDKRNLEERDELTFKLTDLTKKLEIDQQKIQDMEKILELKGKSFNHQLATEHRKTRDALDQIKKLELEQRNLNQMLTDKERLLDARNIYFNRFTKNNTSTPRHKANVAKAIQTEECISPIKFSLPNVLPTLEKKAGHSEKETLKEVNDEDSRASKWQQKKEDIEIDFEAEKLRKEYVQAERRWKDMVEKDILENLEKDRREKQEKERDAQFFKEALESGDQEQEEINEMKETEQQKVANDSLLDDTKEIDDSFSLSECSNKTPSRLRRRYRFTEQTENLHQGLPVCKLSYAAQNNIKRRQDKLESKESLDLGASFSSYEPSFGKLSSRMNELRQHTEDRPSEKPENRLPSPSKNDKKNTFIESLFRSGDTIENKICKDSEADASDKLKQLQKNKQTSRIQVTTKNRLNLLDPELLPVRVLESSADENEKLVLQ